ncbi:Uncharacterized protein TCM_017563 [Theobroma cacao]|uniref:Uncharacterized protein n=1 Tax=Theobroma cacao TaxID=3641 RepID=A0A061ELC0_THECC|nr:Uncharacterized protein TCM_017563 [Theobroma cacao]
MWVPKCQGSHILTHAQLASKRFCHSLLNMGMKSTRSSNSSRFKKKKRKKKIQCSKFRNDVTYYAHRDDMLQLVFSKNK